MDLESGDVERRNFSSRRKGYDRAEVTLYLRRVGEAMAELETTASTAELRVGELERDVRDLHTSAENGFHQAVASSALSGDVAQPGRSATEADRIIAAAGDHAARLRGKAEDLLEDALATTERLEADQARLLAEAEVTRDLLLADARIQAASIIADAKAAAATTRSDAQRFAEELRELTAAETIELVAYAKAMAAAILDAAAGEEEAMIAVEDDLVTVDLRDPEPASAPDDDGAEGLGGPRPSRYEARSANLPRIGDDQASSAIDSVESLREAKKTP